MSRGDGWSVAVTLIVTGAAYFAGGKNAAYACLGIGLFIAAILHFTRPYKKEEKGNLPSDVSAWHTKWREMASEFSKLPGDTRADWYGQVGGDVPMVKNQWEFRGGIRKKDCEALCRLEGAMLLKSPKIAQRLSTTVGVQKDNAWRWLYFLKENSGVEKQILMGDGISHGILVKTEMQSINGVSSVSQRICIECAAEEI